MVATPSGDWRLAVDIGGTFTDLVLVNGPGTVQRIGKVLTTPKDPAAGVMDGARRVLAQAGVALGDLRYVIHGTTLITNALIERKGARVALVTTAGHEDALAIGRETRYDTYDLSIEKPAPLVPAPLRRGVSARMLPDGTVLAPVDPREVTATAEALVRERVEAIAVSLLHSYADPAHERAVAARLAQAAPGVRVTLSSDVVREIREYERTSTTVANAYVLGLVEEYLQALLRALRTEGFRGELLLMLSSGGTCTVETACRVPIRLAESGPAGGAAAAAHYGRTRGAARVLSFDMGGTTAKVCFVDDGEPRIARECEVARMWRFKRGSGLPVIVPVIELIEIGAGGGSIARVDRMGLPKVGPDSAGSEPGPACYGRGGELPTVTDANLVLGYLDAGYFLGGAMTLSVEAARAAIEAHVAKPLGVSVEAAAWGIHALVSENMANAALIHGAERGKEIGEYRLYAYGGAGPIHACQIAERLRLAEVVIPPGAGARTCFGFLTSPLAFEVARSHPLRLGEPDQEWDVVASLLAALEAEARIPLGRAGVPEAEIRVDRWCEMRYRGQGYEVEVALPDGPPGPAWAGLVRTAFERAYRALYQHVPDGHVIEAVTWRLRAQSAAPDLPPLPRGSTRGAARKGERPAWVAAGSGFASVPVYDRYALAPGDRIAGPAIVEEAEATTVVTPAFDARVDDELNLVLESRR
jgi:N-methylhydantoinase A